MAPPSWNSFSLARMLHAQLEARYGKRELKSEHEPRSFLGYTILRDRKRRAITLSMAAGIEAACRASLRRMGLEYFDLYLVHAPCHQDGSAFRTPAAQKVTDTSGY